MGNLACLNKKELMAECLLVHEFREDIDFLRSKYGGCLLQVRYSQLMKRELGGRFIVRDDKANPLHIS